MWTTKSLPEVDHDEPERGGTRRSWQSLSKKPGQSVTTKNMAEVDQEELDKGGPRKP